MPRQMRVELAGACYHVMARGDRREAIFVDEQDREDWLEILGRVCGRHGWRVHAWVLMDNHYHFLLETPEPNLVKGMRELQQSYTQRFNRRHGLSGHLFGGRYKAVLVDDQGLEGPSGQRRRERARGRDFTDYFLLVADYIHLNPVRARMVKVDRGKGLLAYGWSSLKREYAQLPRSRHHWMETQRVLAGCGWSDTAAGRRRLLERLETLAREEAGAKAGVVAPPGQTLQSTLRRGWYFGRQEFAEGILQALKRRPGVKLGRSDEHYEGAKLRRQHGESEAERLVRAGLRRLGVRTIGGKIAAPPRGDSRVVAVAEMARERTSVSESWLAERLGLRSAANVSQRLARLRRSAATDPQLAQLRRQLHQMS